MEEKKFLTLTDDNGKETEYEILMAFKWTKTSKNYVVYTDNTNDENGNLNIYAAIYYPNDSSRLDSIETDEEWDLIERKLKAYRKDELKYDE